MSHPFSLEDLPAIEFEQNGVKLYLSKLTAQQLVQLSDNHILKVEKYQRGEEETYQREEDIDRIKELSSFLTREEFTKDTLVKSLLPASIVFNAPDWRDLGFDEKTSKIRLKPSCKLNIVDGQHRVRAICNAFNINNGLDFEVPITIVTGLARFQEAAQFLIINLKQKSVRTDLALTVLYDLEGGPNTQDFVSKLKAALKIDAWQLEATGLVIVLNDNVNSPLHNLILRPNEDRKNLKNTGRIWIPVRQAGIVDTLRVFCSADLGVTFPSKEQFLIKLWGKLKSVYPAAFSTQTGKGYMLLKGNGIGPIHVLAPLVYALDNTGLMKLDAAIDELSKEYPESSWSKKNGTVSTWGSSQKEFNTNARGIAHKIAPKLFTYWDQDELKKLSDQDFFEDERLAEIVEKLFDPFSLKPFYTADGKAPEFGAETGCYVLIDGTIKNPRVYVGQSKTIEQRIKHHDRPFKLYNFEKVAESQLDYVEALIWHLVKTEYQVNDVHPPLKSCPFCKHVDKRK